MKPQPQPQLFVGKREPKKELFNTVENRSMANKGSGGLWTSSFIDKEQGSEWVKWCLTESFHVPVKWEGWLLYPKEDAKIYTIDSVEDGRYIYKHFGYKAVEGINLVSLNFEKLKEEFDGLHLTSKGQLETRYESLVDGNSFGLNNFYGWDCESTYWLDYKFSHVEPVELTIINPYNEEE